MDENFRVAFYSRSTAIGISIYFNEEFKFLDDTQLDEIEKKYSNDQRQIFILLKSNIDQKFSIQWHMKEKKKMLILEVTEDHGENLNEIMEFTSRFLMKSLQLGESGESNLSNNFKNLY